MSDIEKLREKELQNFTSLLSLKLGIYMGQGLFKNYPDNFNQMIPQLAKELSDQILFLIPGVEEAKQHYEKELLMAEGYMEMAKEAARVDTLREVEDISWVETINYKNPKRVMYETEWETLKCREQDVRTQRD